MFDFANRNGALNPNSPVVLRSLEWTMCALERTDSRYMPSAGQVIAGHAETGQSQLACFLSQPEASSYPEFHPWMYSLDTLRPVGPAQGSFKGVQAEFCSLDHLLISTSGGSSSAGRHGRRSVGRLGRKHRVAARSRYLTSLDVNKPFCMLSAPGHRSKSGRPTAVSIIY